MENHTEYIDDYFAGNLNPEERKNFERQMEQDKNFATEVAFYIAAKQALKEELADEKKEWFRQLASQNVTLSEKSRPALVTRMWVYRLAAAAVVVGIIFFSWSLFLQPSSTSPNSLADQYISTELEHLSVRMASTEDSIDHGINLYNEKDYDSALRQFQTIIQRGTSDYRPTQFAGEVCLKTGNYNKALEYFHQLEKFSLEVNPAVFLQALTLMKRNQAGDKEQARHLLTQVRDRHLEGEDIARRWLDKKW